MKRFCTFAFTFLFLFAHAAHGISAFAGSAEDAVAAAKTSVVMELNSRSACLMEPTTGEILFEQNAEEHLEPASVTKIMSVLLIYEALNDGRITKDDIVTASAAASEMGGSQIWLEAGEQMTVDDMLKAILVVSANDCTVAMAEHLAGSEATFVSQMNERAAELGMTNTHFENSTGLPAENHYTCAKDIAIMTRELLRYSDVFSYTTIWMDSLRGGEMGLTNTNKLVRFYPGATGMKTGFTSSAGYCMSATATRENMSLIAVVMKADTSDHRFEDAKKLLNYGFSNFTVYPIEKGVYAPITVRGGKVKTVELDSDSGAILLPKGRDKMVECLPEIPESVSAPIKEGDVLGVLHYSLSGEEIATVELRAKNGVRRVELWDIFEELLQKAICLQ